MKHLLLSLLVLFPTLSAADVDIHDAFITTTSCAIVLGAAANEAEKNISFDPDGEGVFIGDWIEFRLAANTYEDSSQFYAKKIRVMRPDNEELTYEYLVDAVYRGLSEMSDDEIATYAESCMIGYVKAMAATSSKEFHL